jgi:hypothetical protein
MIFGIQMAAIEIASWSAAASPPIVAFRGGLRSTECK